jgi:hypothetical protein
LLNEDFCDLYHNRLEELIIVFRRIEINLWNVGKENVYVRVEVSRIW